MDRHIITIEDPIEYFHKHKKSLINQREIGIDVPDFPEAIRRALRMDPDIILVGEMRDLATISAAITAAETGHIVFGTLHTNSAEGTVNRIIDVFPKEQQDQIRTQLSVAIIGILAQALLPRKPKGLVAAYEMLVVTPAISNLIRENKTYRIDSSIQTGRKHGMILLDDSLFNLWRQGLVEENEVMFKCRKPQRPARADRERQEGNLRRGRGGGGRGRRARRNADSRGRMRHDGSSRPMSRARSSSESGLGCRVVRDLASRSRIVGELARLDRLQSDPGRSASSNRSIGDPSIERRPADRSTTAPGRGRSHGATTRHDHGRHGLPRRGNPLEGPRGAEAVRHASCSARWRCGWGWSRKTRS